MADGKGVKYACGGRKGFVSQAKFKGLSPKRKSDCKVLRVRSRVSVSKVRKKVKRRK